VSPLWILPCALLFVVAGITATVYAYGLREYVQKTYPEEYRRATWTSAFGEDSKFGSDFMSTPYVNDPELKRRRTQVMDWRIVAAIGFALCSLSMYLVFIS
jgi:hypothetical protein